MKLKILKMYVDVQTPKYGTEGAACFDIFAYLPDTITDAGKEVGFVNHEHLIYGRPLIISTGLKFEIPKDYVLMVYSRSGHGFKSEVRLANGTGVIDSDYRGELKVKLTMDYNEYAKEMVITRGTAIAQAMLIPVNQVDFAVVYELSETERGDGGFGSTGN